MFIYTKLKLAYFVKIFYNYSLYVKKVKYICNTEIEIKTITL